MNDAISNTAESSPAPQRPKKNFHKLLIGFATAILLLLIVLVFAHHLFAPPVAQDSKPASVTVSAPLEREVDTRLQFLGQFSAIEHVELRAQVGGTLTKIGFKDGDIVNKGDLLFEIEPTPYEIMLSRATAQLESAKARLELATTELERANKIKPSNAISIEDVEKRASEKHAAQAAMDDAKAMVRDAHFDLDHCRISAPFTGQIGTHLVSVGNLVAGSRAASSPTTLLAILVSLDPIYLDFDMSEADYMKFARQHERQKGSFTEKIYASLSDERSFNHEGTLTFLDNALDRSSGTIHARATMPNTNFLLTPGGFARVRLALSIPAKTLLVPDSAVLPDLSSHFVLTVGADNLVTRNNVEVGELRGGLRVIRSGLTLTDKVIIDGIPTVSPGLKVTPTEGSIVFQADQE
jgi:RND family efflux transporter MFP subunit